VLLKYLWAFLLGLVFLYLQLLLMPSVAIAQVIPNILLAWLIYNIWSRPLNVACVSSFLIGLMYDATLPGTFGMNAMVFVLLCVLVDLFRKPFEIDSVVARMLTLAIGNLVYTLISYLIMGMSFGFDGKLTNLIVIGFAYNLVLSLAAFWLMTFLSRLEIHYRHDKI